MRPLATFGACLLLAASSTAQDNPRVDSLVKGAKEAFKSKDWARARTYLRLANRLDPKRKDVAKWIGLSCHRLGVQMLEQKRVYRARDMFHEGTSWYPANPHLWLALGRAARTLDRAKEAEHAFRKSIDLDPTSAHTRCRLGTMLFEQRRYKEAAQVLESAQKLDPKNKLIQQLLERARKDGEIEQGFAERTSRHFLVRFHGERRGLGKFVPEILRHLERTWVALVERLQAQPKQRIVVLLYTKTEFRKLGTTWDWVRAYYDGKVRVPLDSWSAQKNRVQKTLRHELSHAFLYGINPMLTPWLHEGFAQWFEGERVDHARDAVRGKMMFHPKWRNKSFIGMEDAQVAARFYAQSLVLFTHLHEQQGLSGVRLLLEEIGRSKGGSTAHREDRALREVFGNDLDGLLREVAAKHRLGTPRR